MKKFFAFALALVAFCAVSAQETQDAKTLYNEAKKLEDAFNKGIPTAMNPKAELTPEAAKGLLTAMDLYEKVLALDTLPDAKGKVKPKYTDKIMKSMAMHAAAGNFARAGGVLFNAGQKYPDAYNAFMTSGTFAAMTGAVDSVYAIDFFNAGNCAFGTDFPAAHVAYTAARQANIKDPQAYTYDIASLQNIAHNDESMAEQCQAEIRAISKEAVDRFGTGNDYIFNNYMQHFIDDSDYAGALAVLDKAIAKDASHDNYYRLRGLVNFSNRQYQEAVKDFIKMAEVSNNYAYLREAANYINDCGKRYLGTLDTVSPDQKAAILEMYKQALSVADKAAQAPEASSVDDIIEDINYNIENANNL